MQNYVHYAKACSSNFSSNSIASFTYAKTHAACYHGGIASSRH